MAEARLITATQTQNKKAPDLTIKAPFRNMGWTMGIEPTTTGITIQDSTAELQPPLSAFIDWHRCETERDYSKSSPMDCIYLH